jgi:hypothetical protein
MGISAFQHADEFAVNFNERVTENLDLSRPSL